MPEPRPHYERAFEDFLRRWQMPYVAVHEAQKAIGGGPDVKAFDFLVYAKRSFSLLVDVKGRALRVGKRGRTDYLPNWSTVDDLTGLDRWVRTFGPDFRGVIVWAYCREDHGPLPAGPLDEHQFEGRTYGFCGVSVETYQRHQRPVSAKWQTVTVPQRIFRLIARPVTYFLGTESIHAQDAKPPEPELVTPIGEPTPSADAPLVECATPDSGPGQLSLF